MVLESLQSTWAVPQVFVDSFAAAFIIFLVEIALFAMCFKRLSNLYWPLTEKVAPKKRLFGRPFSLIGWIKPLFASEVLILQRRGFDIYLYVRFAKMVNRIAGLLAISAAPILIVTNAHGSTHGHLPGLFWFSMGNISLTRIHLLWVHVGIALLIVAAVCHLVRREQMNYVRVYHAIHSSPESLAKASSRTVLVRNIPSYQLSDMALTAVFSTYEGGLRNVSICTDYSLLDVLAQQRHYWTTRLEDGEFVLIERAQRRHQEDQNLCKDEWDQMGRRRAESIGQWVGSDFVREDDDYEQRSGTRSVVHLPAIDELGSDVTATPWPAFRQDRSSQQRKHLWKKYMSRREYWDEVDHPRRELARVNGSIDKARTATYRRLPSAFACFNYAGDALEASNKQLPETMEDATVETVLDPQDIRWDEIARPALFAVPGVPISVRLYLHVFLTYLALACLTGLFAMLVERLLTSGLAKAGVHVPKLLWHVCINFLAAYSYQFTYITWLWVAEFKATGEPNPVSRARIACRVQSLALCWTLWWALAYSIIPHSMVPEFLAIFQGRDRIYGVLFRAILRSGNGACFFQLIVAMQSTAGNLLRPRPLLKSVQPALGSTPRDVWRERTITPVVDWPLAYNPLSVLVILSLCLGVTTPLLLPVTWMATAMISIALKFSMLYIESPEYETRGLPFRRALDHVFVGLYGMEGIMFISVASMCPKRSGIYPYVPWGTLAAAIVGTAAFQIWSWKSLDHLLLRQGNRGGKPNNTFMPDSDLEGPRTLIKLPHYEHKVLIDNAYKHPGARLRSSTAWIPQDHTGVSDDEIRAACSDASVIATCDEYSVLRKGDCLRISNDGAAVGHDGRCIVAKVPPDHSEYDEIEV